jgi:hypothetical protein
MPKSEIFTMVMKNMRQKHCSLNDVTLAGIASMPQLSS